MEFLYTALILLGLTLFFELHEVHDFSSLPDVDLGRIDSFNDSTFTIAYTPVTPTTQRIMDRVSLVSYMTGRKILAFPNEENMTELISKDHDDIVKVIFTNAYSYHLKFIKGTRIPVIKEHQDHTAHCYSYGDTISCDVSSFWTDGFVALQAAINAAIIEVTTNQSVMEEMMSLTGKYIKIDPFLRCCYKRKEKDEGLDDSDGPSGFSILILLSWGLLYGVIVFAVTLLLTFIVKLAQFVFSTGFMVIFSLFFFYGLSLLFVFLNECLTKEVFPHGLGGVLSHYFLWKSWIHSIVQIPSCILGVDSKFAQPLCLYAWNDPELLHLDYDINSNADPVGNPNVVIGTIFMLFFDGVFYLMLTFYFEKVLPSDYGRRHPPLFFLKSSFWSGQNPADRTALDDETDYEFSDDSFEPVSTEFHGKEAIRIRNLTKDYIQKSKRTEALKDLTLDVYKGQITAILGHSGAGKSTLLNVLSGLCVPTKGWITIHNNKLSEMTDLENISKLTGVCPQCNVHFDFLTVRENLRLFAKIKGIQAHEVDNEVQRVLLELEMKNIQDILVQNLSGGQKRKLTFGIAILGDPQIFLLDEPTAGLDPFSRHRVWNLLKERKADRVVLFSTQFMDEADILADRKVFLSQGKLKCAGSSLFLKKKWGIGYHLSLQLSEACVHERITSLVKQHIPDSKLLAESEGKLNYILPLERTNKFPGDLERCPDLGIENYGVSITTLTEVFLKLEGKSAIDQSGQKIYKLEGQEPQGDLLMWNNLSLYLMRGIRQRGNGSLVAATLCSDQASLLEVKVRKEIRRFTLILIWGIGLLHILSANVHRIVNQSDYCWELAPQMYFLTPGQQPQAPLTNLLIVNKTGAKIDDFIHSLEQQNIALEVDAFGTRNGTEDSQYNGAIILSDGEKILVDIVSNGLLGLFAPTAHIQTDRSTFLEENDHVGFNYMNRAQFQLWISGLSPSAYWFGQALFEVPVYCVLIFSVYIAYYASAPAGSKFTAGDLFIQILYVGGYAIGIWSLCFYIASFFSMFLMLVDFFRDTSLFCSIALIPLAALGGCTLLHFERSGTIRSCDFIGGGAALLGEVYHCNREYSDTIFESEREYSYLIFLAPLLHFAIFLVILQCLERKFGMKTMRMDPVFRISSRSDHVFNNPEEPEGEDEDVGLERVWTANALTSAEFQEKPAIIASCLRKEYKGKKKCFVLKSKKKIAARNISFCVRKGEVVGLLGHNGAGKSTTIKLITGETKPSAGQTPSTFFSSPDTNMAIQQDNDLNEVLLKGNSTGDTPGFLGYCPQENALWLNLTVREHLEIFAAVKGMRKSDADLAITRLADALKLQDQLKSPVKTLSEGVKRKLCFVLSILGNPSVVLLDEPSTGMDPEGQQQMWQAIQATFANTERGALLTTHYMAEAEAVCDRVAIMVSGRLRCIGSIQHLKSKFGKEYLLEMKVKTPTQVEPLNMEIMRLFPQAARQERYSSLMVYKLPREDVQPLSQAFFKLETVKQSFDLEEYSLSQSTLEQVFLELSKEQELDGFEEELDPSVKWKLLPQEEA
ncbi:ABC-type organic anion transporter ABCA8A [Apodemus speciosus]|uniref:ABC-type organic anion transporter ABCA8A n=1 Tax=Apodemus speciosus TaxID=105296 RepID=A0ABQ0FD88_APOSI